MILEETLIKDLLVIIPTVFKDDRGYFFESYNNALYAEAGILYNFIQDNQSFSTQGVVRGLHMQAKPYAQAKLVRVVQGEILDVAVDLRNNSPTYGKYFSVILSSDNRKQLMIPPGFAHGFSVLSDSASVIYKVDQIYNKDSEIGIRYDDSTLGIDWQVNLDEVIISEKDLILPSFNELERSFE